MRASEAIALLGDDSWCTVPGWKAEVTDYTHRFSDSVVVRFVIADAPDSGGMNAPEYASPSDAGGQASHIIHVGDITTGDELIGRVLDAMIDQFAHEAREYTRLNKGGEWVAPYHPHQDATIMAWSERTGRDPVADYKYGLA